MKARLISIVSNILVWNEKIGFIRINEGTGDNLVSEDEAKGFVDYIMLDFMKYDGIDLIETDGAQIMLTELYQEKFENEAEVVQYLIDTEWIPDVEYVYLHAE